MHEIQSFNAACTFFARGKELCVGGGVGLDPGSATDCVLGHRRRTAQDLHF